MVWSAPVAACIGCSCGNDAALFSPTFTSPFVVRNSTGACIAAPNMVESGDAECTLPAFAPAVSRVWPNPFPSTRPTEEFGAWSDFALASFPCEPFDVSFDCDLAGATPAGPSGAIFAPCDCRTSRKVGVETPGAIVLVVVCTGAAEPTAAVPTSNFGLTREAFLVAADCAVCPNGVACTSAASLV